jgi:hypothetical protein
MPATGSSREHRGDSKWRLLEPVYVRVKEDACSRHNRLQRRYQRLRKNAKKTRNDDSDDGGDTLQSFRESQKSFGEEVWSFESSASREYPKGGVMMGQ